ncbi:MAG TPA: hypothetical protein DDW27_19295 [Bacteroidales bacterium]|nr:hypothetical protein [Bacteroidales bacterium]
MYRTLIFSLLIINLSCILYSQDHPDLGLNGTVTWLDATHIRVEYDWSADTQLLDWVMTDGTTLVRGDGFVTITDGSTKYVRAMMWKQGIKCNKIIAKDATALSSAGHLNFYSNIVTFTGHWLPDPGLGAVLASYKNFWAHDGINAGEIGAPYLVVGEARDYEYTASTAGITIKSSVDDSVYAYNASCLVSPDRLIVLGGWGGNTRWGKIIIEGEITIPPPSDVINIQSNSSVFAPVIEVTGEPLIEWTFDDNTVSTSTRPVKDYGTEGYRHNYLKVTPWSALIGINVGYDAADGGYGDFDTIPSQNVSGIYNLHLAKSSLKYICANENPLTELDIRELSALEFVELNECKELVKIRLGDHPVLERLCVEDCHLDSLDLSGCTGLEDLRAALNNYTFINWGSIGQSMWHICTRDNPQMNQAMFDLTQFPVLQDLWIWNTNQSGPLICHSPVIKSIRSDRNYHSIADVSGCTSLVTFSLSGNKLDSVNLGTANNLTIVRLKDCGLTGFQVDYILNQLDQAGKSYGYLDITQNSAPSSEGMIHLNNLRARNWTIEFVTGINTPEGTTEAFKLSVTEYEIRIWLNGDFSSWKAGLFDFYGKSLISKTVDSDIVIFDIQHFPQGIYFVVLSDGKERMVKKVIKP